jgi:hypothetical protein
MNQASIHLVDQLRGAVGHLAACLLELAQLCRASHSKPEQQLELLARLFRLIPDRRAAQVLLNTHGAIAWAGTFGQSPYSDFTYVLRCAVDGHGLMPGPTANQRELHGPLLDAYATPAARARWGLDRDQLQRRYPRLLRAMQDAAILTRTEAESTLLVLLRRHPSARHRSPSSCEAVHHFGGGDGGNMAVIRAAIRRRQLFPSARRALTTA